jgi:hypothetical protein
MGTAFGIRLCIKQNAMTLIMYLTGLAVYAILFKAIDAFETI